MLAATLIVFTSLAGPSAARSATPPPVAAPALDELLAKARAASGEPYKYRVVSRARESENGHTFAVSSETQGVKYVARRCERDVCSGFYFDGERSFNTNINDTALPISPLVDGLQLTLRAIASYAFTAPDFRSEGGHLAMRGPVLREGKRYWRVGVAPNRGAILDAVIDAETGLVAGVISDERHVAFEFKDQRRVGKLTLPYEVFLDGRRIERFDERAISSGDIAAPTGVVPSFANGAATVKLSMPDRATIAPVVPCTIGNQSAQCLLDTGNSGLSMSLELAERLGIEPTGAFEVKGVGEYTTGVAKAPPLSIGGVTYPSATYVLLHDMHAYGYDVVLGADAFAHAKIAIDYPDKTVTFAPASEPVDGLPTTYTDFIPVLAAKLGGMDIPLQVDTGDESTINLAYDFYQAHPAVFKSSGSVGVSGIGGASEQATGEISSLKIGDYAFARVKIGATKSLQTSAAGHIGSGILQHFTITFDYAHDRIGFAPKSGDPIFAR